MRAYVIGLGRIPYSFESAMGVYNHLKNDGLDVAFHEGTYGDEVEEIFAREHRTLHPISFKGNPVDEEYRRSSMRLGVMACFHSHWRLWQRCVELDEPILIFEDDVIFERGWLQIEWQDVLLIATGKSVYKDDWYAEKLYRPTGPPQAVSLNRKVMPGAVGYGLTPQGAAKLTSYYHQTFVPADNAMNAQVVQLQCHNYLMGRAALEGDGKKSLTKTRMWSKVRDSNRTRSEESPNHGDGCALPACDYPSNDP